MALSVQLCPIKVVLTINSTSKCYTDDANAESAYITMIKGLICSEVYMHVLKVFLSFAELECVHKYYTSATDTDKNEMYSKFAHVNYSRFLRSLETI